MSKYRLSLVGLLDSNNEVIEDYAPQDSILMALYPLNEKGLVFNYHIVVRRNLIEVNKEKNTLIFEMLSATNEVLGYAFLEEIQ